MSDYHWFKRKLHEKEVWGCVPNGNSRARHVLPVVIDRYSQPHTL